MVRHDDDNNDDVYFYKISQFISRFKGSTPQIFPHFGGKKTPKYFLDYFVFQSFFYLYTYIYICVCVYVCVCVRKR